jgi:hypothetical protein
MPRLRVLAPAPALALALVRWSPLVRGWTLPTPLGVWCLQALGRELAIERALGCMKQALLWADQWFEPLVL